MKKLLLVLAVAIVPTSASAEVPRQDPPYDLWCRDQPISEGSTAQICMAYTLQQCLASRVSHSESCYLNPRYAVRQRR